MLIGEGKRKKEGRKFKINKETRKFKRGNLMNGKKKNSSIKGKNVYISPIHKILCCFYVQLPWKSYTFTRKKIM